MPIAIDLDEPDAADRLVAQLDGLGLAVRQIKGVGRFEPQTLQPPSGEFPECLTPYQSGYFDTTERILVLDTEAIATAPALFENPFL